MRFDVHIHHNLNEQTPEHHLLTPQQLMERLNAAGLDGGVVLSESPIAELEYELRPPKERIDRVIEYCKDFDTLFPFFFIDPTDEDAAEQVKYAAEAGIAGFKIICTHFYPNDPRAVETYHRIAEVNKPILFHSGILYDGLNASGNYNRPCNFEVLLKVPKLRFALAHISWPWTDECIAVFGKFCNALAHRGAKDAAEMFIDTTPGTPPIYRADALKRLIAMGGALIIMRVLKRRGEDLY